jgi:predicted porin
MSIKKQSMMMRAVSLVALAAVITPAAAKADQLSDLRAQLALMKSQVADLDAKQSTLPKAKQRELATLKDEVAQFQVQLTAVQAAPPPPMTPPMTPPQTAPKPAFGAVGGFGQVIPPGTPKPGVGGIPLILTKNGAFFVSGTLDEGIRLDNAKHADSLLSVQSGLMRASRLTFEGYQDIGFGLRAIGVIEAGLQLNNGLGASNPNNATSNTFDFGRTTEVGLGNDQYGYLAFGRQYTPIWSIAAAPVADPFGANYLGGTASFAPALAKTSRASNNISFSHGYSWEGMLDPAPPVGLGFALDYSPGQNGTGTPNTLANAEDAGREFGAGASYGTKVFWVGGAYQQIDGYNTTLTPPVPGEATVNKKPYLIEETLAASYLTPKGRILIEYDTQNNGIKLSQARGGLDSTEIFIGAVIPTLPHEILKASYGYAWDETTTRGRATLIQLSYEYDLVKVPGTALYIEGGLVENNKASNTELSAASTTNVGGGQASSLATGIRFIF